VEPEFAASGNLGSRANRAKGRRKPFEQPLSAKATDLELAARLWDDRSVVVEMPS
jgi:hypothetical protein